MVHAIVASRLRFTRTQPSAIKHPTVHASALQPSKDGSADLSNVLDGRTQLGRLSALSGLVDKSSVPVGTAEKVREVIAAEGTPRLASRVHVVSNPEFLKEGAAIEDFMRPDRIVVGTETGEQKEHAHIYSALHGKQTV